MSSIGIDLTGASAGVFESENNTNLLSMSWVPSTIMPMMASEPIMVGVHNANHRRGAGLDWPPESQVPYCFDAQFGYPRQPLARVWQKMLPLGADITGWDDYMLGSHNIEWRPNINKPPVGIPAEDHILETVKELISEQDHIDQLCLVVPDDLGEGAQQAILDRWAARSDVKLHLVPRPIAIAMNWCRLQEGSRLEIINPKTSFCGHLIVLALGLDRWEVVPIEIRVVEDSTGRKLIPVRDHTIHNSEIAVDGFGFLAAYGISSGLVSESSLWNRLMCRDFIPSLQEYANIGSLYCEPSRLEFVSSKLRRCRKHWMPYPQSERVILRLGRVRDAINQKLNSQLVDLNRDQKLHLVGIVSDGIFSRLPLGSSLFPDYLLRDFKDNGAKTLYGHGNMSAIGAAQIAHDLVVNSRTYRDRIAPIDIWHYREDEFMDPVLDKVALIESHDIEAGETYKTKEPIRGLKIRENTNRLEITLRRKFGNKVFNRKIQADLRRKTTQDENVLLHVKAKPGQGFAVVDVESERSGLFEAQLNWRKMEQAEKPNDPRYAWPPGMANILCDRGMANRINNLLAQTIEELEDWRPNQSNLGVDRLREQLNKWPKCNDYYHNPIGFTSNLRTTYLYCGCVSSSSTLSCSVNAARLERLSDALGDAISIDYNNHSLIRLAAWLYEACPVAAIEVTRKHLREEINITPADLMLIGNVYDKPGDMRLFYEKWVSHLTQCSSNNNWLRAFRNMIRFRVMALSKEVLNDSALNVITYHVYNTMFQKMRFRKFTSIYDNCLYIAPHLLKRRKFEPEYLSPSSKDGKKWIQLFEMATSRGYWRQREAASATLRFLKREGSQEDLEKLWGSETNG